MTTIDIVILIILALGAFLGFKRGFIKETVSCVGFVAVVILSFLFKDQVSVWLYTNLPFFKFGGVLKGVTVLNILLYEVIAFFLVFTILMILLKVVLFATGIVERILDLTIVLGVFSSILGAIVGLIEAVIIVFLGLYVLTLPTINKVSLNNTEVGSFIMKNTPILSDMVKKPMEVIEEFASLKNKYETAPNANQFNYDTLDLFLKYKVITVENVETLVKKDKLRIDNLDVLLDKYREAN